jgi:hypothetical protein
MNVAIFTAVGEHGEVTDGWYEPQPCLKAAPVLLVQLYLLSVD